MSLRRARQYPTRLTWKTVTWVLNRTGERTYRYDAERDELHIHADSWNSGEEHPDDRVIGQLEGVLKVTPVGLIGMVAVMLMDFADLVELVPLAKVLWITAVALVLMFSLNGWSETWEDFTVVPHEAGEDVVP